MDRYEMPWRPNYESWAAFTWGTTAAIALLIGATSSLPSVAFHAGAAVATAAGGVRGWQALRHHQRRQRLFGRDLPRISVEELLAYVKENPDKVLLGRGFLWEQRHAQATYEILKRDRSSIIPTRSRLGGALSDLYRRARKLPPERVRPGALWLQGLEPKDVNIEMPLEFLDLHMLLVGTTGSGKTRNFDLLISQAIARGEAVIIIDPKGDKDLCNLARRMCEAMGQPERFIFWHPGFAEDSVRIDPLHSFGRGTEVASRIASLMPGESASDPFRSYAQMALNNVGQGLILTGERPSLVKLKSYLEGSVADLVIRSILAHAENHIVNAATEMKAALAKAKNKDQEAAAAIAFYRAEVKPKKANSDLEGLLGLFEHDRTHFGKMIASLLPLLTQLTSGDLGALLSPDPSDTGDTRRITDTANIIRQGQVAYIGLDSLSDAMVGSAVGSILLADLAAVAGDRYNYGVGLRPVNIFVDEAAEAVCDPFIQVLNKGRGAKVRATLATQTLADFEAKLGSPAKARQVLGNVNNVTMLRVRDADTQEFLLKDIPPTKINYVMRTQGANTQGNPLFFGGNSGERLMEEEADLFPAAMLGEMPTLEMLLKSAGGQIYKGVVPLITY